MKISKLIFTIAMLATIFVSSGATKRAKNNTGGNVARTEGIAIRNLAEENPSRRSWGSGQHFEESTAIRQAEANARGRLAAAIQTMIKTGFEAYISATTVQSGGTTAESQSIAREMTSRIEDYISAVSKECVTNTATIKTELYNTPTNEILAYVCVEYKEDTAALVQTVKTKLGQAIPADIKESISFEKFVYEKKLDDAFANYKPSAE